MLAITEATRVVERGDADACLARGRRSHPSGAAPSTAFVGAAREGVPFKDTGAVPGEGDAVLIVESLEHATAKTPPSWPGSPASPEDNRPTTRDGGVPK